MECDDPDLGMGDGGDGLLKDAPIEFEWLTMRLKEGCFAVCPHCWPLGCCGRAHWRQAKVWRAIGAPAFFGSWQEWKGRLSCSWREVKKGSAGEDARWCQENCQERVGLFATGRERRAPGARRRG